MLSAIPVSCNGRMLHGCSPHAWYNRTSTHSNCVQHKGMAMSSPNLAPFVGQKVSEPGECQKGWDARADPRLVCRRAGRPVCLYARECWEGQTDTPPSAYPSCPLYDAWKSDRPLGRGRRHPRGCYDRSPWACVTTAQIWLDEAARRPLQSSDAPGTGRHRYTGARVTMGADHGERPWWNAVGGETVVTLAAAA